MNRSILFHEGQDHPPLWTSWPRQPRDIVQEIGDLTFGQIHRDALDDDDRWSRGTRARLQYPGKWLRAGEIMAEEPQVRTVLQGTDLEGLGGRMIDFDPLHRGKFAMQPARQRIEARPDDHDLRRLMLHK